MNNYKIKMKGKTVAYNHTTREIVRSLLQYARIIRKHKEFKEEHCLMDSALSEYFKNWGEDQFIDVLNIADSLLWTIHWKYYSPASDMEFWKSRRRYRLQLGSDDVMRIRIFEFLPPQLPA